MFSDNFEKVRKTAEDLTTLEINTIVKRCMTGAKTPDDDKEALYRLAGIYSMELERLGNDYAKLLSEESAYYPVLKRLTKNKKNLFRQVNIFKGGGVFSFREIGIWASFAETWLEDYDTFLTNKEDERIQDRYQLKRITAKCLETSKMIEADFYSREDLKENEEGFKVLEGDIVKEAISEDERDTEEGLILHPKYHQLDTLEQFPEHTKYKLFGLMNRYLELKPSQPGGYNWKELNREEFQNNTENFRFDLRYRLALRKSIDIGVEMILMQTRIGMDGDITTRLTQSFSEDPKQFILDIHNTSIRISVGFWEKIFDAIMSFFNSYLKRIK